MNNYTHKKIIEKITNLDEAPSDSGRFAEWIKADAHLTFLRENAVDDEVVIYALGKYSLIHSAVVSNERLFPINREDLMGWSFNAYSSIASYVSGGERKGVWLERGLTGTGTNTLEGAVQLVFARTFEGWSEPGRDYLELNQEYAHLAEIHWRPEKRAFCRFNGNGDIEPVVSVTNRGDRGSSAALVTFKWEPLEEYLVASNSSLVRMFDFTLYKGSGFADWSSEPAQDFPEAEDFFYRRKINSGTGAYTRGVQIIGPRRPTQAVQSDIMNGWMSQKNKQYVEFIAYDWRNKCVTKISTDPSATTNYFVAKDNSLPYELSPAFFRPEVLSKYKTDRDKYTVSEREVSCRAAWHLKGIDVNEAGQVHAYIVYLRHLPYSEQLHWQAHNEDPKTGISVRAITTDFEGKFTNFHTPLGEVLSIARRWNHEKVAWWKLRDEKLPDRVNTPLTASRDEWAEAFMDLAKLVIEGFETPPIRQKLDMAKIPYDRERDRTIVLLEKLLNENNTSGDVKKLVGLRTVQNLRSKAKGHASGNEAQELAQEALMEHETFANHFKHVCEKVVIDLQLIEGLFLPSPSAGDPS
ncbi:hypothetical protein [Gloeobacter kilaueensis]|uniref:Uncharacterized protein n=1 Tax=Gloeobacter kilaueensis (strain ATCC BAA-2537 / CCAP 1431/1 / ULC 316 / JS1) TaxID=1183438 RepID=U5QFG9_GLOK1|nr:hypothetical protein [Gloeobacter kilaueensis]AGY57717.1 hypothetical protein GKIL_1471 [Gloeobacter kilaueensis JS1]